MRNVASRMVRGSVLLSIANAVVNGLTMLTTVILARYLTPADYGLVAIATTLLAVLSSVTNVPLGQALIRHQSPDDATVHSVWTVGFIRGLILAAVFAAAAYPVAGIYGDPRLITIMLALSAVPLLFGMENPRRFILQRDLNFKQEFVLNLSAKVISFVLTVAVAAIYHSYWALVIGNVSLQLSTVAISYVLMAYRPRVVFSRARDLLAFSIWLTAGQIISTLNWRVEYLLIGKWLGTSSLGVYSVANNLSMLPTQETIKPLKQTIYPGFSRVINEPGRIRAAYQRAQTLVTAIALPVGVGVALIAEPLVTLVMGQKWLPVVFIMQCLASIFALQTLGSLVQPLAMAKNETRLLFVRDTQMLFLRLPVIILGLVFWGLTGVVVARIVTGAISIVVNMLLVKRLIALPLRAQLTGNVRSLASIAVMTLCVVASQHAIPPAASQLGQVAELLLQIGIGAVSYCAANLLLWVSMNRPDGPEMEILRVARGVISKAGRFASDKSGFASPKGNEKAS